MSPSSRTLYFSSNVRKSSSNSYAESGEGDRDAEGLALLLTSEPFLRWTFLIERFKAYYAESPFRPIGDLSGDCLDADFAQLSGDLGGSMHAGEPSKSVYIWLS